MIIPVGQYKGGGGQCFPWDYMDYTRIVPPAAIGGGPIAGGVIETLIGSDDPLATVDVGISNDALLKIAAVGLGLILLNKYL
jgi:hypothetical protein